jgi:glycosyltransferase involved in cell wall biosynthesis
LSGRRIRVLFQNPDDRDLFVSKNLVPSQRAFVIQGVGVNVREFEPAPEPPGIPIVLFASRILWDKGVGEFVEASRLLKAYGTECRMVIAGIPDAANPQSVDDSTMKRWREEGFVELWGLRTDMPEVLKQAGIVVLPSYREGMPRILLEAAAMGRPIIATDVPGCRYIVSNGVNGYLVPVRDPVALAKAIEVLVDDPRLRAEMGERGHKIAVSEFSEEKTIRETIAFFRETLRDLT